MTIILSQLTVATTLTTKQSLSTFEKQLKHYNAQEKINNNKIKKLMKTINQECKQQTQNECSDVYIQLQEEYDNVRRVRNLKNKLFSKHNLHWDEEYY